MLLVITLMTRPFSDIEATSDSNQKLDGEESLKYH